ncbi:hypothetical protein ACHAQA_001694 [Verticillium albo-atrum]
MSDNDNLRTASLYINNQLLSRGLLSDGHSIDFARPERNPGGVDATMGKVMSIVNDLILRRDRDAQNREALSTTLRTLRAENLKGTNDVSRLSEKHAEARRKLEIAEASEAAARTQLKSADAAVRGLKEEMARAKVLVAQTRSSCATEVRRRDRQIDGLKKQLGDAGRARGSSKSASVTVINVVGDVGDDKSGAVRVPAATGEQGYDLRNETNQFLTELARNLSEENAALLGVVRRTLGKLKDMSGWEKGASQGDGHALALQTNCDEMEGELEAILEHLRTILTNPSFVPIEEVEAREDEINRLKEGWVKMESRWQEAVHLMDGWRKRLVANGRGVNMEELDMGLRLSPIRVRQAREPEPEMIADSHLSFIQEECTQDFDAMRSSPGPEMVEEESLDLEPAHDYDVEVQEDDYASESSIFEDEVDVDDMDVSEPNIEILQQSTAFLSSSPLPPRPQLSPLKETASAGNRGTGEAKSNREKPSDFSTIAEERTWDLGDDSSAPEPSAHRFRLPRSPLKAMRAVTPEIEEQPRTVSGGADSSMDELALAQPPSGPPSPSPLPRERTRVIRKPTKVAIQKKPATETKPEASKPVAPRTKSRSRVVSDKSVDDSLVPVPAIQQTPQTRRDISPRHVSSRLPLPRPANPPPQQSPLTMANIAAKLAASEREADAARVRAKLKAARGGKRQAGAISTSAPTPELQPPTATVKDAEQPPTITEVPGEEDVDPVKRSVQGNAARDEHQPAAAESPSREQQPLPKRKRDRRVSKVASRRRSTLNPWEMESLISGNMAAPSPGA